MAELYIKPSNLYVWVHTWWKRDNVVGATLASLDESDARNRYGVHRQREENDKIQFFIDVMRLACSRKGVKWVVRIEDDTVVNKHLIHNICTWPAPHVEANFGMGFLSVPTLALEDTAHVEYGEVQKTPWRNYELGMHFGGGVLYNAKLFSDHVVKIRECMETHRPGLASSICPSQVFFEQGLRSYFHVPSLVKIDLTIPRYDGKVVGESVYGPQPFDPEFKRQESSLNHGPCAPEDE